MTSEVKKETMDQRRVRVGKIIGQLGQLYPNAHCALHHRNAFELLVATVLSAQCTDERVNQVTPQLFRRFPNAEAMARAAPSEVESCIRSTGFFRAKAKSLRGLSRQLLLDHGGEVPETLEALTKLPGVGRKTANVVLGNAFGLATGVVVDTHVKRLAYRLGWTTAKTPERVETDLIRLVDRGHWIQLSHELIFHGRQVCQARRPRCETCALADLCPKRGVGR